MDSSASESCKDEILQRELHEMLVPATLRKPLITDLENSVSLNSYYIEFSPDPKDRIYKKFGLFVKAPLPGEAERMELDLHLSPHRSVKTKLVPTGIAEFDKNEIMLAQNFQEMYLKIILDRSEFIPEFVPLGKNDTCKSSSSTFYLLLPVVLHDNESTITVDWEIVRRCLSSPVFRASEDDMVKEHFPLDDEHLQLFNGYRSISDVENSLVYCPHKKAFFFITNVVHGKNGRSPYKETETSSYLEHLEQPGSPVGPSKPNPQPIQQKAQASKPHHKRDTLSKRFGIQLKYPGQPLLHAKQLSSLHNLLLNKRSEDSESRERPEYFIDLPPELCQLKIIGFSKDIGSSISLLPSIMYHLENLLVASELKHKLSLEFPEGAEVSCHSVLEALTTTNCQERFSLERLETLGDAFLKFAVGRHLFLLHDTFGEGELTRKRSDLVENLNLYRLAIRCKLQVYIRDNPFDPSQFFALGRRPCLVICNKESESNIHSQRSSSQADHASSSGVRCSKGHHWLQKGTISDVVEALVGAFIVDSGFRAATSFLRWIGIQVDFEASHVVNACISSTSYIPLAARLDIAALENLLGYQFLHKGLLIQAFVHPSCKNKGGGCYQRLEFLGDAVLDYLMISYLYSVYPKLKPGQLTDLRSVLVNNKAFANVAVDLSFNKYLISDSSALTKSINTYVDWIKTGAQEESLIDGPNYSKALSDLVESSMGAILLDSGFNLGLVWKIALSFLDPIKRFSSLQVSPIRELRELCQAYNLNLQFLPSNVEGKFLVEAQVNGKDVSTTAFANNLNKKEARGIASQEILTQLKAHGLIPKSKTLEKVLKSSSKMEAKLIGYDEPPIDVNTPEALRGQPSRTAENHNCDRDSQTTGGSHKVTARSRLQKICDANCWKTPLFECCREEGPSHLKLFTFKVVVEKKEAPDVVLECFGAPQSKKEDAEEHAAEGALWYLKHDGYLLESD